MNIMMMTATVECPEPPQSISNGHLLGETGTFTVGQSVTYLCDLGFVAQGPSTLTCQGSGNWSSSVPTCVGKQSVLRLRFVHAGIPGYQ